MNIAFGQIYIEVGVKYPYSVEFQQWISEAISARVDVSSEFSKKYGQDFSLGFSVSAKDKLDNFEIRGPTVYKRNKEVEYTIFLPFRPDAAKSLEGCGKVLGILLKAVVSVLVACKLDPSRVEADADCLVEEFLSMPSMLHVPDAWERANGKE